MKDLSEADPWEDQALCAETDPEVFFPPPGGSVREAMATCRACTVRPECLEYVLSLDTGTDGVWAATTERERARLRRRRATA